MSAYGFNYFIFQRGLYISYYIVEDLLVCACVLSRRSVCVCVCVSAVRLIHSMGMINLLEREPTVG